MATVFTKIIKGDIPSYRIGDDERFYAFLDINPLAAGHTLVVPREEVDCIFDLNDATLGEMMIFAKGIAARIRRAMGAARVAVVVVGLDVPHAHIHLIPINSEADVDFRAPRRKFSPEEFAEIQKRIIEAE